MIAKAVRNTFSAIGTRLPSRLMTASAKAISVATGTAQPRSALGSPRLKAAKTSAGAIIPPRAARPGAASRWGEASSPDVISRRNSSPTSRKNTTMSPSLTQRCSGSVPGRGTQCSSAS